MRNTFKKDIRALSREELLAFVTAQNEKAFRLKQLEDWLWKKSGTKFDQMHNLPPQFRKALSDTFCIHQFQIHDEQFSVDGTIKYAFKLHDGALIEGVLIPSDERVTACISSQVGCSLTCKFCATGYMKRQRNLEAHEIYDQVVLLRAMSEKRYQKPLSNIVFMGMGEPLLNYNNVISAIAYITGNLGLHMSAKRLTVSTAGIAKQIKKLADEDTKTNLALSLHAANDQKRNQIMPINEHNNLSALKEALQYYYQKTKNRITFEYIIFHQFNDTLQDAEELYQFSKAIPSKVNIIEYNPISAAHFQNAKKDKIDVFAEYLEKRGMVVKVRRSRGKDIDAACGQLAIKNK